MTHRTDRCWVRYRVVVLTSCYTDPRRTHLLPCGDTDLLTLWSTSLLLQQLQSLDQRREINERVLLDSPGGEHMAEQFWISMQTVEFD